jgi:MYXO-CTERM domain-containing protein
MHTTPRGPARAGLTLAAIAALCPGTALRPAAAQVTQLADFQEDVQIQTGTTTTADQEWYFNSRVFLTNTTDATSATLTYPGPGSPATLTAAGAAVLSYTGPNYASQAALLTAYPLGTYTAVTQGGTQPPTTVSLSYQTAPFPVVPIFTASTFAGAQGLNAAQPFTFAWNSFSNPTTDAFVFFTVSSATTGTTVFSGSFLPTTTTSQTLSAGTLIPGQSYTASLDYSSRIDGTSNGISTFQGFDRSTSFTFTAAPEPSAPVALALGLLSLAGLAVMAKRRHTLSEPPGR